MKPSSPLSLNPRWFLRRALAATAFPLPLPASVIGRPGITAPSGLIAFASIGIGGRARAILPNLLGFKNIQPAFVNASAYESGQSAAPFRAIEDLIRKSAGDPALKTEIEAGLVKMLAPFATFEAKRFACQHLAFLGSQSSVPALAKLLADEQTTGIACLALSVHPSPSTS